MNKKEWTAQLLRDSQSLFRCPICHGNLTVNGTVVRCSSQHLFDIAKKGYINFYGKPSPTDYDRELFESRYQVIQNGMYDPLHQKLAELIDRENILDIGCGEGSHLANILQHYQQQGRGVGIDISKDGIQTAAKYHPGILWTVADLANSPFQANSFDVLLNILSPANYQEFRRLAVPGGLIIKVIPRAYYLIEIREQLQGNRQYVNDDTSAHFRKQLQMVKQKTIQYKWDIPSGTAEHLWRMTPLTWGKSKARPLSQITVDLDILVGKV
ncbi:methyltransferase domain-containing protein [Gracilibacillus phocaeensis]|uniref:methyltransferase domain-containing protein n=1 Tax=Gracilibacillus phocaeensis TaxID=2042304 RepID=UPI001031B6EF|nr:methyltransferase domain-containing protein [Gracilibacillus phocaeensis]